MFLLASVKMFVFMKSQHVHNFKTCNTFFDTRRDNKQRKYINKLCIHVNQMQQPRPPNSVLISRNTEVDETALGEKTGNSKSNCRAWKDFNFRCVLPSDDGRTGWPASFDPLGRLHNSEWAPLGPTFWIGMGPFGNFRMGSLNVPLFMV